MSAKHAVLGLVIERPDYGYQLAQRLEDRFGASGFAPSGVYSALDHLMRDDLVRSAGQLGSGSAKRAAPRTIYEATPSGVEHFECWMFASTPTPPLRDDLQMKIALCRPSDVPRLIDMVYGQELACLGRLQDLRRLSAERRAGTPDEWSRLMRGLADEAEVSFWSARIEWLQAARVQLERLRAAEPQPSRQRRRLRAC
ncbi:MAG TPA: helix-turn-helix transcriptional regulator [Solirubrobacteraceae bacterium]|nr:helix-turn-helix transcriptional regulator [Solirubrobacteraceae bacterium]